MNRRSLFVAVPALTVLICALLAIPAISQRLPRAEALRLMRGMKFVPDVRYAEGSGKYHLLDVLMPAERPVRPAPVVVYIHGGGWRRGDKQGGRAMLPAVVAAGYIGVSINYRLTGEARFPAQIEDCKAAIRYVRKHASEWGGDPDRVGVFGTSAGGHLVALLGASNGVRELEGSLGETGISSDVEAVCDWFGPADLMIFKDAPGDGLNAVQGLLGGKLAEARELARMASPVTFVDGDEPPFLIIHGDKDPLVPVAQSQELYDKLIAAGDKAELIIVPGGKHGDFRGSSRTAWNCFAG